MENNFEKQDRLIGKIVLIGSFLVLMGMCHFANSQISRFSKLVDGKEVVCRYTESPLCFQSKLMSTDTIYLNAMSDSVDIKTITFNMYAFFPKTINPKQSAVIVTFTDGTTDKFIPTKYNKTDNYVEYAAKNNIDNLLLKKVDYVVIESIGQYKLKNKSYFKDFLQAL